MMVKSAGLTDRGKKREKNEDSILLNRELNLYIVADGMGGHERGDVASRMAVLRINELIQEGLSSADEGLLRQDDYIRGVLRDAMAGANREIVEYSRRLGIGRVMGTTASLLLTRNGRAYTGHVGDSRIYRLRNGEIEKLTKDHSRVQELVDMGVIAPEEAEGHYLSHIITRALGSHGSVEVDTGVFDIEDGDSFLLSTDGLFRVMGINEVREVMMSRATAEERCRVLINRTLEGGAPDNVSVIIMDCIFS